MGTYFFEEYVDRYGNVLEYAIPSIAASLIVLIFKISIFIQDSRYQIIRT